MNDDVTTEKPDEDQRALDSIRQILIKTKVEPIKSPTIVQLFRRLFSHNSTEEKYNDADCTEGNYHEIIPRLFLGDYQLAMDPTKMKNLGFTHILNAAQGRKFGQINTSATYYEETGIEYLGFSILDTPLYQINKHFEQTVDFLQKSLNQKKSRVYVHCQQGISRSATLVIAYLLHTYQDMSLFDAFQLVSTRRRIWPNDGFCRQLIQLDREIKTNNSSVSSS